MNASNIKDKLSTICGWVIIICGAVLGLQTQGIVLPSIVTTIAVGGMAISGAIIGILTGKNPNGTTKIIDPSTGQQSTSPSAVATATK